LSLASIILIDAVTAPVSSTGEVGVADGARVLRVPLISVTTVVNAD
jgi:hypothetical protein